MDNMRQVTELNRDLENRSSEICALALSSESQAVWINAFGPIAFCKSQVQMHYSCCRSVDLWSIGGCWLRDQNKLDEIIRGIQEWGSRTGWPVTNIIQSLRGNTC